MSTLSRQTSQSPSESARTESAVTGPIARMLSQTSQRSSITEEDENQSVIPPAPPLPPPPPPLVKPFALNSSINTKSYSRASEVTSTSSASTPRPLNDSTKTRTNNTLGFQRTVPRRSSSEAQQKSNKTSALQKLFVKGSAIQSKKNGKSSTGVTAERGKSNLSVFEKVDRHNGHTTYLGTGTFSQIENCIRNSLCQDVSRGISYTYPTRSSSYKKCFERASILEDYSYEGLIAPREQINISTDHHSHHYSSDFYPHHYSSDYYPHHRSSDYYPHHYSSRHTKHASELPLDEIRQVNDALAKYGIPILSHHDQSHYLSNRPRPVGDILSTCQQLLADPSLHSQRKDALQHVWDNIHFHSPQTNISSYTPPGGNNASSHFFSNPYQSPHDPVHNVASHLFHNSPSNNFYAPPPPPPPPGPYGGGPPQNYYNPPPPPPPPPPPAAAGSGQSVLARLFGR